MSDHRTVFQIFSVSISKEAQLVEAGQEKLELKPTASKLRLPGGDNLHFLINSNPYGYF